MTFSMVRVKRFVVSLFVISLLSMNSLFGWGSIGHRIINLKSGRHLPAVMNAFKADSSFFQAHASDADNRRNYSDTTMAAEQWRHYIDIDSYPDFHNIPHEFDSLITLFGWFTVKQIGTLPWATIWTFDSLTAQLARGDTNQAKLSASDLGHYVGDGYQPLHATANYDGQFTGNNGIHSRYESSMLNDYQSQIIINPGSIHYINSPLDYIFDYIYISNSLVDSVIAADNYAKIISGWDGSGSPPPNYYPALWEKCQYFTEVQFQNATISLASLWYTAWVNAGFLPFAIITPQSINFGSLMVKSSKTDSFTVNNIGAESLEVVSVISNNEQFTIDPVSANIPAGSSQKFYVSFSPFTAGVQYGIIRVNYSGLGIQDSVSVAGSGHYYSVMVSYGSRWNLVSNPVNTALDSVKQLFQHSLFPYVYSYSSNNGYEQRYRMEDRSGFWAKFIENGDEIVQGFPVESDTIDVNPGWNLIGSISYPLSVHAIGTISTYLNSQIFSYNSGYKIVDTIKPGKGYWVKVSNQGKLILTSAGTAFTKNTEHESIEDWKCHSNRLIVEDASENQQILYCRENDDIKINYEDYELPPIPPKMIFDARFESQRLIETYPSKLHQPQEYKIDISSSNYPITVIFETAPENNRQFSLKYFDEYQKLVTIRLNTNERIKITDPRVAHLILNVEEALTVPKIFVLHQNYPNPFNPSTVIGYEIPVKSWVTLKGYNIIGEEIATLVDGIQEAGIRSIVWDGSYLPSGVYIFRLKANNFVDLKRVTLLR